MLRRFTPATAILRRYKKSVSPLACPRVAVKRLIGHQARPRSLAMYLRCSRICRLTAPRREACCGTNSLYPSRTRRTKSPDRVLLSPTAFDQIEVQEMSPELLLCIPLVQAALLGSHVHVIETVVITTTALESDDWQWLYRNTLLCEARSNDGCGGAAGP